MCSGRLDPTFVMKAFASGADGVLMTGCWPADCHYRVQNVKALRRFELLHRVLEQLGIEPERFQRFYASAAEGSQLAAAFTKMIEDVRPLGPLGWGRLPEVAPDDALDGGAEAATAPEAERNPGPRPTSMPSRRWGHEHQRQAPLRDVLGRVVRRLRHQRHQPARGDPRFRRALRHRLLAGDHGRQVRGRRGDARPVDRPHPVLGRDPEYRERRGGPAAPTQVVDPGRLRIVRQRGVHPRPGEPDHQGRPPRPRLRGADHGQPGSRPAGEPHHGARGRAPPAGARQPAADARPDRRGRLPHARLPAGDRADRRGHRAARGCPGRQGRAAAAWLGGRRGAVHGVRRMPARSRDQAHRPIQPAPRAAAARPEPVPARTGRPVQRPGDPQRLRRPMPAGRRPVHRLLRPGRGRGRLRGAADVRVRLGRGRERPGRDRPDPRRPARPGRPVLPLQPGRLAAARQSRGPDRGDERGGARTRHGHGQPTEPTDDPPDDRPDHPARGPRQDRDLPRRPG